MSKFIDNAVAKATGVEVAEDPRLSELSSDLIQSSEIALPSFITHKEYLWETKYTIRFHCRPEDFNASVKNCERQLREAIYGEFRFMLIHLEKSIYERDFKTIMMIIKDMYRLIEGTPV